MKHRTITLAAAVTGALAGTVVRAYQFPYSPPANPYLRRVFVAGMVLQGRPVMFNMRIATNGITLLSGRAWVDGCYFTYRPAPPSLGFLVHTPFRNDSRLGAL